jgi:hypothetical protein
MAFSIIGNRLAVKSRFAYSVWILHAIFLLVFPTAIWAMWTTREVYIPVAFNSVFTLLFLGAVPFLIRGILKEHLVCAELDAGNGTIQVCRRGLFKRSSDYREFGDIERIEMRTSESDGEFHSVYLVFRDGFEFPFLHGNHRQGVESERDRFVSFIRQVRSDVIVIEQKV